MDYKNIFNRAKAAYGTGAYDDATLEFIFPELAGCEDERMINGLQGFLSAYGSDYFGTDGWQKVDDWLEKQKERKNFRKLYEDIAQSEWFKKAYAGKSLGEEQPTEIPKEPHYTKRNELFDKCVKNCDPKVMKEVSDKIDEMLQKEQKPAEWSEVELEFRGEKVKVKRPFFRDDNGRGYSTTDQDEEVSWNALRAWCEKKGISLYDLYPKAEWSEEDEEMLDAMIDIVSNSHYKPLCPREGMLAWLKSLRPVSKESLQSHWKPSEAHLSALLAIISDPNNIGSQTCQLALTDLYEQLKKL